MHVQQSTLRPQTAARGSRVTPFKAALSAFRVVERRMRDLSAADSAADAAAEAVERETVPYPEVLTRTSTPIIMEIDGKQVQTDPRPYTFTSARTIQESDSLTDECKTLMLEALAEHTAAQLEADERTGAAQAAKAAEQAHEAFMTAHQAMMEAAEALMRVPTREPADIKTKRSIIKKYSDFQDDHVGFLEALVESLLGDNHAPTPERGDDELLTLGDEFEKRWAAQRAYDIAGGDEGYEALDHATDEIADAIRKTPARTLAGFKLKAKVVQFCQGDDLDKPVEMGFPMSDSAMAASLVNDLLGIEERPWDVRQAAHDEEKRLFQEHLARHPSHSVWERARASYLIATAADDACEIDGSEFGRMVFTNKVRALRTYLQTPPPSAQALATCLRDAINFDVLPHFGDHADDPASLRKLLDNGEPAANYLAIAFQHASRLAGETGPHLEPRMTPLTDEVTALIDEYEALGGHLCTKVRPDTLEPYEVCIRIEAPRSDRAIEIEGALKDPGVALVVLQALDRRTREGAAALRRGEGVITGAELRAALGSPTVAIAAE